MSPFQARGPVRRPGRQAEFHNIVVGAGTAGCVVAARLSQDPGVRVLLLEAGACGAQAATDADLRQYIRPTVSSYYHPAGTCRMGTGADAVTDPQLRVRGVAGLRVADASVMPVLPNAHPNATVLAIAERAAELLSGREPAGA